MEQTNKLLCLGVEDRVQYWQARWATGQSQWHSEKPHQYLVKVHLVHFFKGIIQCLPIDIPIFEYGTKLRKYVPVFK